MWKIVGLLLTVLSVNANAQSIPSMYRFIANKHGVPLDVFFSMIKHESGRTVNKRFLPWPWTLNVNHQAYYYNSKGAAQRALRTFLKNPKNTIAVGLGQIYLPAHGSRFPNPLVLLNPKTNLNYAAHLLKRESIEVKKRTKRSNWWLAVGRYHHPSKEKYALPYRKAVYKKCLAISSRCHQYGAI